MKRFYLLRHAKSSWALPGISDIKRPLNNKGNTQTRKLNHWFATAAPSPDMVICSPALRTLETLDGIRSSLNGAAEEIDQDLYNGSPDVYLQALWRQDCQNVMIIGHNPTCDELSRYLTAPSSPAADNLLSHHFGTATLAVFDFSGEDWSQAGRADCQLIDLIRPKDLQTV